MVTDESPDRDLMESDLISWTSVAPTAQRSSQQNLGLLTTLGVHSENLDLDASVKDEPSGNKASEEKPLSCSSSSSSSSSGSGERRTTAGATTTAGAGTKRWTKCVVGAYSLDSPAI
ncbi:hypothetical protein JOB18_013982 [Solea senegalensis]|uniref:Uncharacterized protein n=1 Tax=Solea senegalensis TaxID=28829 RepID=A0AAV6PVC7_SOLSE|nr:hypothetical protein JOB18_013982 [Solea senegalensis]